MTTKKALIQLPVSLTGLFDDKEEENECFASTSENENEKGFQNESEIVMVKLGGSELRIRQMVWHKANANIIWPGTYNLVDHMMQVEDFDTPSQLRYENCSLLELGSATGALSLALIKSSRFNVCTR